MKQIIFEDWKVAGSLPWQADFSKWIQEGEMKLDQTPWINASVPGSIYKDLQNAGLIDDPYFDRNSLSCEWVANRWWIYRTAFCLNAEDFEETLELVFHGIDYAAKIYLNGTLLGRHEGMYHPFVSVINSAAKVGTNILVCVLEHAPFCHPQPGYTSQTRYLKARFNYKWDFAVRLVDLGLYDSVSLTKYPLASIRYAFLRPVKLTDGWELSVKMECEAYRAGDARLEYSLLSPDQAAEIGSGEIILSLTAGKNCCEFSIPVANPELWWPNGYGAQPLYHFTAKLYSGQKLSDQKEWKTGFRTIEYFHADGRTDALAYGVKINGKRIYLKGTNIVPLDCMNDAVDRQRILSVLGAAHDANVNFLRIWGGGNIESEAFYSICDELGILILQEFPMSSSGCDDVPSRNPDFLKLLYQAAVHQIKQKRNHPSLAFWDGGNELTDARFLGQEDHEGHPASLEDPTLALLKGLISDLCPDIQMLPSSGSGPNALLNIETPGKNHDVHGPWGFMGVQKHYELYNKSDSIVHGEFGCGGISSMESICRFLPPDEQRLATSAESLSWAHHSGGWDSYAHRERLMFGDLKKLPFSDYIYINQFVQAESLRYSLEANRRREWKNVGEMTWQFNEPWPNVQCSNVLDYYGGKKLAWYSMRDAYAPVLASLRYNSLFYSPGDEFNAELWLTNDLPDSPFAVTYTVADLNGTPLLHTDDGPLLRICESGIAQEDTSCMLCEISFTLPSEITGGFSICLQVDCGGFSCSKEYLFLIADKDIPLGLSSQERAELQSRSQFMSNGIDAKRADTAPVIEYVKRFLQKEGMT